MAKDVGGSTCPGSGSSWSAKGDVKSKELLIECKRTDKDSLTLKASVLSKIQLEAIAEGKMAVLSVEIRDHQYAVIDWDWFLELCCGQ